MPTIGDILLDVDLIRSRRLELGLARRELVRITGINDRTMLAIERGLNHPDILLGHLVRLAETLGLEPHQLFLTSKAPEPTAIDVKVEAALQLRRRHSDGAEIRRALGLTELEWAEATDRLRQRLANTGSCLITIKDGRSWIAPREGALTAAEAIAVKRPEQARSELNLDQARMLKRIIDGETGSYELTRNARTPQLMALGYLEKNGIIKLVEGHYKLPAAIKYSLGLTNTPPPKSKVKH